jgi:hypothetical protein
MNSRVVHPLQISSHNLSSSLSRSRWVMLAGNNPIRLALVPPQTAFSRFLRRGAGS